MEVNLEKSTLKDVLSKIQGITRRKTHLAITEMALIRTTGTGVTVVATDLETGFEGTCPATVERPGAIAVNAKKLFEIVREFPRSDIWINEAEKRWIEIGAAGAEKIRYHIVGMDPDDFPETPTIEAVDFFEMDAAGLKKVIEQTVIVAGAANDKRAHISGLYFEILKDDSPQRIRLVATDGSRLSTADAVYQGKADLPDPTGIIVPKKGMSEVARFLSDEGTVKVGFKENHFIAQRNDETITIRLLEGEFPRYLDIINRTGGQVIKMDRRSLMMMLRRMSILSTEAYKGVIFNFSDGHLVVTASNPEIGESKEEMEIEYDGEAIEIAFNPRYFIDALNVITADTVTVDILDQQRPCLVRGEDDGTYLSVIMPMKI